MIFHFTASFWTVSISFMLNGALYGLKRVLTRHTYSPKLLVEIINQRNVTFFFATPSMMQKFVKSSDAAPLTTLGTFMLGGTTIQNEIVQKIQTFVPNALINNIYGMTEGRYLSTSFTKRTTKMAVHSVQMTLEKFALTHRRCSHIIMETHFYSDRLRRMGQFE